MNISLPVCPPKSCGIQIYLFFFFYVLWCVVMVVFCFGNGSTFFFFSFSFLFSFLQTKAKRIFLKTNKNSICKKNESVKGPKGK